MPLGNINLQTFRKTFDGRLAHFWDTKLESSDYPLIVRDVLLLARTISLGGKRLRPYMAYVGYYISGGRDVTIIDRLVGIELFHIYALIHDDIIDKAKMRHGSKTVHIAAQDFCDIIGQNEKDKKEHIGLSYGILAGDMMFSWASEVLFSSLDPMTLSRVSPVFSKMIEEVIAGQIIDVSISTKPQVDVFEIETKNILKTARYTFVNPLTIGSLLSGQLAKPSLLTFFEQVGTELGTAFQIRDDLLDIIGDSDKTGKPTLGDVEAGQHTYFTDFVFTKGKNVGKELLRSLFGSLLTDTDRNILINVFKNSGAIEYGNTIIAEKIKIAKSTITESNIDPISKSLLLDIASAVEVKPFTNSFP